MALRFARFLCPRFLCPRFLCLGLALACALAIGGAERSAAQLRLQTFERDRIVIETVEGTRHRFEVELALNGDQQAQGLMYRRRLADDAGMLFFYGREWPLSRSPAWCPAWVWSSSATGASCWPTSPG